MTREDAIRTLKEHKIMFQHDFGWDRSTLEALDTAIEALSAEPCGDAVSRQAVIDTTFCNGISCNECSFITLEDGKPVCSLYERVMKLPPVTPKVSECEDCISRAELLKAIDTWDKFGVDDTNSLFRLDNLSLPHYVPYMHYDDVIKCIKGMPSVTPQPKTGHWIEKDGYDGDTYYDCSVCGESWTTIDGDPWDNGMNYCPHCGAKMAESEE